MALTVVPYAPEWPAQFARVAEQLRSALKDVPIVGIEHVGSTSVVGLNTGFDGLETGRPAPDSI